MEPITKFMDEISCEFAKKKVCIETALRLGRNLEGALKKKALKGKWEISYVGAWNGLHIGCHGSYDDKPEDIKGEFKKVVEIVKEVLNIGIKSALDTYTYEGKESLWAAIGIGEYRINSKIFLKVEIRDYRASKACEYSLKDEVVKKVVVSDECKEMLGV